MEADFSGYATKAGLKCSDGRIIMPDAFKHMDGAQVPLVWQHGHREPKNVLGHAILEHRHDGVYAYGYFNDTPSGVSTKALVKHKDIRMLSIYANQLVERGNQVIHGAIREVSLVLAGANPGALIDNVNIAHSDGEIEELPDEAIIYTGLELEHSSGPKIETTPVETVVEKTEEVMPDSSLQHAGEDKTIGDVYESLSDEQKTVVHYMIGVALEEAEGGSISQSDIEDFLETQEGQELLHEKGYTEMTHNVFEQGDAAGRPRHTLSHADVEGIVADAMRSGSLKDAVENYAIAHGIDDIDILFPEARTLTDRPEWVSRRMEWVSSVLGAARKSPFSRIKTLSADLTYDEARAKGYIKGNMKKEEFFGVAKRTTTPTTIYKKQGLDRDDMVDITDFDVVSWLKAEMRIMLDEELARAILFGDGRDVADEDKIGETHIRPVAFDDEFFTIRVPVDLDDTEASPRDVIDAIILSRRFYKGTGLPTYYTTESWIGQMMVLKDNDGKRMYRTIDEVAAEMRVAAIVPVEVLEGHEEVLGVLVNLNDYVIGADKGGEVSLFDDFDIDYNKYKYLIETRVSGALVKPKSAMVVVKSGDSEVVAVTPSWNPTTGVVTIPTVTGVEYIDTSDDSVLTPGAFTVDPGEYAVIQAGAKTGFVLAPSARTRWTFRNRNS
jgi:hypothetical protein